MTISEVSKKYDLIQDTLRYYEKIGLLSNVPRNKSGIRNYDDKSCRQIDFIKCMMSAGMQIETLVKYMALFKKGKKTVSARKELLVEQREILVSKQEEIMKTIERLDYKISLYSEIEECIRKDYTEEI